MVFGRTQNKFRFLQNIPPLIFLVIISLYSVWPLIGGFYTKIISYGDSLLLTWIINQNIQKIPFGFLNLFRGNIFYPDLNVIAFSDIYLPSSLLAYVPVTLSGSYISGFNFVQILSQIVTALTFYLFLMQITKDPFSSLVASVVLILSQLRFYFAGYLQMWSMEWFILALWSFWNYIRSFKQKYLLLTSVFASVATWNSLLPLYFIVFSAVTLLLINFQIFIKYIKNIVLPLIVFSVLTLPLFTKYNGVSNMYHIERSVREAAHFSMNLNDLWEVLFSPALFILFIVSLYLLIRRSGSELRKEISWFIIISLIGLLMALGPVLKIYGETFKVAEKIFIPLPYGIFYYLVPGFEALRTPLRWIWLMAFGMAGVVAISLSQLKLRRNLPLFISLIIISIVGGTKINNVFPVPATKEFPEEYQYIKNLPGNTIVEIPLYTWGSGEIYQQEFWRMYFSLYHRKNLVNGTSGFYPPEWENMAAKLWTDFPDTETLKILQERGADYVVVHKKELDKNRLGAIEEWYKDKLMWENSDVLIYQI